MPIQSFNYTGRIKIDPDAIALSLSEHHGGIRVAGSIDTSGLVFPTGEVVLEVYRHNARASAKLGTANGKTLHIDVVLPAVAALSVVLCEVRIVEMKPGTERGKILAAARKIRPEVVDAESGRRGILGFDKANLGQVLWELDLQDDPVVLINQDIGNWKSYAVSGEFGRTAMSQIVREIARWLWLRLAETDVSEDEVVSDWVTVFQALGADPLVARSDAIASGFGDEAVQEAGREWILSVVGLLADRERFLDKWLNTLEESEDE